MRESRNIHTYLARCVAQRHALNAFCAAHSPSILRTTSHRIASHQHMARRWRHDRQLMQAATGRMSHMLGITCTSHATMLTMGVVQHCQRKWRYNMYTGTHDKRTCACVHVHMYVHVHVHVLTYRITWGSKTFTIQRADASDDRVSRVASGEVRSEVSDCMCICMCMYMCMCMCACDVCLCACAHVCV